MTELLEYPKQTENYEALDQGRCYWVWKPGQNKVRSWERRDFMVMERLLVNAS